MFNIRLIGDMDSINEYMDMLAEQEDFFFKPSQPMDYMEYVAHNMKKWDRNTAYRLKQCQDSNDKVVFIKMFKTRSELLADNEREKRYREKTENKDNMTAISTSSGVTFIGKRNKNDEDQEVDEDDEAI